MSSAKHVNSLEFIEFIRTRVADMLCNAGFKETTVYFTYILPDGTGSEIAYQNGELHCLITFLTCNNDLGILKDWVLIEYAESLHDAQLHMYVDGCMIPLDVDIATIIAELKHEVKEAIKRSSI